MNYDQYNDEMLQKLKAFCRDNNITNLVCMLQTEHQQTIIAKVFPNGSGHPFYLEAYNYLTKSVQASKADLLCEHCRAAFTYEEMSIDSSGLDIAFICPQCQSHKIIEL